MLLLSILMLFAGPLLYQWLRRGGLIVRALDHAIVIVLVLMVVFLLVPESLAGLGWVAPMVMALGYLLPFVLEVGLRNSAQTLHLASMLLALAGLGLHAMLDGAGLAASEAQETGNLAIAIVIHRLGIGLVLWLIVQPVFGRTAGWGVLVMMSVATVIGYLLSDSLLPLADRRTVMFIEALIIGTIVHSLLHRGHVSGHRHTH